MHQVSLRFADASPREEFLARQDISRCSRAGLETDAIQGDFRLAPAIDHQRIEPMPRRAIDQFDGDALACLMVIAPAIEHQQQRQQIPPLLRQQIFIAVGALPVQTTLENIVARQVLQYMPLPNQAGNPVTGAQNYFATGTAELNNNGLNDLWFIGFTDRHAVAVMVERVQGGTGGTVAAPIAKAVLEALGD